jgi:hypothetical protein
MQPRDKYPLGSTVDVTAGGIRLSTARPAPIEPASSESGHGSSGSQATGRTDGSRPVPGSPSLLGMATSLAGSMARFAASGFKRVDEQSHRLRLGRCAPCEYRQDARCTFCGCFVAKKAWLPHEDCPLGRWPT